MRQYHDIGMVLEATTMVLMIFKKKTGVIVQTNMVLPQYQNESEHYVNNLHLSF